MLELNACVGVYPGLPLIASHVTLLCRCKRACFVLFMSVRRSDTDTSMMTTYNRGSKPVKKRTIVESLVGVLDTEAPKTSSEGVKHVLGL